MSRRRVLLLLGFAGIGALVVAGVLWLRPGRGPSPLPPRLPAEGEEDPALRRLVEQIRQEVLREPRSARAWGRLGEAFLANGYSGEAIQCLDRAGQLGSEDPRWPYLEGLAQRQNNIDAACCCFQRAAELAREQDPHSFAIRLRHAESLLRAGRGHEARPLLSRFLQEEPEDVRAHLALGLADLEADDPGNALAHLLRCVDSPYTRQRATAQLARVYLQQGDRAKAELYRKRASRLPADLEPEDPFVEDYAPLMVSRQALFLRAAGFLQSHRLREAIDILQGLVAEYPDASEELVKLGLAWLEVGDLGRAEAALRRAVAVAPEKVQAHYFLCKVLFSQAERNSGTSGYEAVSQQSRQALRLKPDHAYAHLYLGLALEKLGKNRQALEEMSLAVRYAPESTDPHLHLGEALLRAGKRAEGLAQLEKAAELADEEDPRPRQALERWRKAGTGNRHS